MLVRGEDRYGHFRLVAAPDDDLSDDALIWQQRVLTARNEAMYDGVSVDGAGEKPNLGEQGCAHVTFSFDMAMNRQTIG